MLGILTALPGQTNPPPSPAIPFTADIVEREGDKVRTSRLHVQPGRYRVDLEEGGEKGVLLVDRRAGLVRLLRPALKQYMEIPLSDRRCALHDPFLGFERAARHFTVREEGPETVAGYECGKTTLADREGRAVGARWTARKLGFPVKIEYAGPSPRGAELTNIRESEVADALFDIPGDFAKAEEPKREEPADPATRPALSGAAEEAAPAGRYVKTGGTLRVKVDPGRPVSLRVINLVAGRAAFRAVPFREGRPHEAVQAAAREMKHQGETYSRDFNADGMKPFQIDAVAVEVAEGLVLVQVEQRPGRGPGERVWDCYVPGKTQADIPTDHGRKVSLTITGASPAADESGVRLLVDAAGGKREEKDRFTLRNGEARTWEFAAEDRTELLILITSVNGGVKARVVQPGEPTAAPPPPAGGARPRPPAAEPTREVKQQLSRAIQDDDVAKMKEFLDGGISPDTVLDTGGRSPLLMWACNIGSPEMVKLLIDRGGDVNAAIKGGDTPLIKAMQNRKHWASLAPLLLEAGADPKARAESNGYTALWYAMMKAGPRNEADALPTLELLIAKGSDVNAPMTSRSPDFDGYTMLMNAAKNGLADVARLLLKNGADREARTRSGKSALDLARERKHDAVVRLLEGAPDKD